MIDIVLNFFESKWLETIGLSMLLSVIGSKIYDVFKDKDLHKSLESILKSNDTEHTLKAYLKIMDKLMDSTLPQSRLYRTYTYKINSSLMSSLSIIAKEIIADKDHTKKSKTVVGLMLGEKLKKSSKTQLLLISALMISLLLSSLFELQWSGFIFIVVVIGILSIHIDHKMLEFRIKKGLYGTNSFESRELINFMVAHSNKNDFNDSGGLKKIIPNPEIKNERKERYIINGVQV